jgi:iron(III) transport system substrate-binding protein
MGFVSQQITARVGRLFNMLLLLSNQKKGERKMWFDKKKVKRVSVNLAVISSAAVLLLVIGLPLESTAISEKERVAGLIEGAKKEGKMVLYTTMTVSHSDRMLKKFQQKYPFIKAKLYRASTVNLLQRILAEARANRYIPDVIEMAGFQSYVLKKKGQYSRYVSPENRVYEEGYKDPEGYWTSIYMNPYLMGYNTRLLSREDIPNTYEGFLNPKWKGKKIGFDAKEVEWFANMLKVMGKEKGMEFMKKFVALELDYRRGHTLIAQLIIAGEFPVGTVYTHGVEERKREGAPIDWVGVAPVIVKFNTNAVAAHAPHPNAAKLYIDFSLSKEGQMLIASFGRIPTRPDLEIELIKKFKDITLYPSDLSLAKKYNEYYRQFSDTFKFSK